MAAPPTPKRHFPMVGLLGLVVIAAAAGPVVYYQFIAPPNTSCGLHPAHRLIFMTAMIKERGGYNIVNAATLNQSSLPSFSNVTGPDLSGVSFHDYKTADNSTIYSNIGDNVT